MAQAVQSFFAARFNPCQASAFDATAELERLRFAVATLEKNACEKPSLPNLQDEPAR